MLAKINFVHDTCDLQSVTAYPSRKQKKSYVPQRKNFKIKLILLGE